MSGQTTHARAANAPVCFTKDVPRRALVTIQRPGDWDRVTCQRCHDAAKAAD
ncbi:hypothetical protein [Microbacterium stercoris]|uniref:Uncharacterized protein n=1 Tax=Microbacterium stercoris TaxID=2820289 RepID=A0A939QQN9_9MICO|nr:hypothetical protein [Microbacterium stercoris]MBO3663711.1 hypothetical protein [Microbacterium stercoris]